MKEKFKHIGDCFYWVSLRSTLSSAIIIDYGPGDRMYVLIVTPMQTFIDTRWATDFRSMAERGNTAFCIDYD